jgi:HK97 family phage portal protein
MGRIRQVWDRLTNPNAGKVYIFGKNHIGGVWLSHDEALKVSALWACISVVSKAIASSQWDVFREDPNSGNRDYLPNSRAYYLFNVRPNPETTPIAFNETTIAVAMLWGNFYAEIERDMQNRPVALWQLDPTRCCLERGYLDDNGYFHDDRNGNLFLRVMNYDRPDTYLDYEDVYHVHGLGVDGTSGLDLVSVAARTLLQSLAIERFALKFYENGTSMGGVLSTEKDLDQDKLESIRKSVEGRITGVDNAFKFLLLGGGLKWESLTQSLGDSQYMDNRYFLIEEICRWAGVPPHKIAHLLRATFSNIEHQGIEFTRDALTPWAKRCEQETDYKILPPGPITIRINLEWCSEGDAKSRAEVDAILVTNGLARRNEIRKKRGQNSLGKEGEMLTVQSQFTTLEKIAQAPPPGSRPPASPGGNDPNNPNDPNEPPDPATQKKQAIKSVLRAAVVRGLRRQNQRIEQTEKAVRASAIKFRATALRFDTIFSGTEPAHIDFMCREMEDVMSACRPLDVVFDVSGLNAKIKELCAAEKTLIVKAKNQGNISAWCNVEGRADEISEELLKFAFDAVSI